FEAARHPEPDAGRGRGLEEVTPRRSSAHAATPLVETGEESRDCRSPENRLQSIQRSLKLTPAGRNRLLDFVGARGVNICGRRGRVPRGPYPGRGDLLEQSLSNRITKEDTPHEAIRAAGAVGEPAGRLDSPGPDPERRQEGREEGTDQGRQEGRQEGR